MLETCFVTSFSIVCNLTYILSTQKCNIRNILFLPPKVPRILSKKERHLHATRTKMPLQTNLSTLLFYPASSFSKVHIYFLTNLSDDGIFRTQIGPSTVHRIVFTIEYRSSIFQGKLISPPVVFCLDADT